MSEKKSLSTGKLAIIGALLGAVVFVCLNIISAQLFRGARIDLTQQRLFSLSEGTKTMIGQVAEPIRFRFFMSSGLTREAPQIAAFAGRVRSMLDAYVAGSNGKIVLEMIDARPYSEEEDRAVAFGMSPIRSSAGDRLFFGLAATNSTDGKATIASFSPEREAFLEYDITRLVSELGRRGKPVVALIDGLGLAGNPQAGAREAQVLTQMKQFFDVQPVEGDVDTLPENTRVLMVVHPQNIGDKTRYAIDQWAVSGGATLIFVDPNAEMQLGMRGAPPPDPSSNLPKLFEAWGVGFDTARTVGDPEFALQTERPVDGRPTAMMNLPWLALRNEGLKKEEAILAQLSAIVVTTAGSLETKKDGVSLRPLLTASPQAGMLSVADTKDRTADLRKLLFGMESRPSAIIAGRLTGVIDSAYPTKPEGSARKEEHITKSGKPLNVILVGDADILMDRNWVQRRNLLGTEVAQAFANNGDFVINAIEQMTGGAALADLRGRGVSWRPFERIQRMEADADKRYRAREQALQAKLKETEQKLLELGRDNKPGTNEVLTPQQIETIERFKTDLLATREELRATQFALRSDVDRLKSVITAVNVAAVPLLAGFIALLFALRRSRRTPPSAADRRAYDQHASDKNA